MYKDLEHRCRASSSSRARSSRCPGMFFWMRLFFGSQCLSLTRDVSPVPSILSVHHSILPFYSFTSRFSWSTDFAVIVPAFQRQGTSRPYTQIWDLNFFRSKSNERWCPHCRQQRAERAIIMSHIAHLRADACCLQYFPTLVISGCKKQVLWWRPSFLLSSPFGLSAFWFFLLLRSLSET